MLRPLLETTMTPPCLRAAVPRHPARPGAAVRRVGRVAGLTVGLMLGLTLAGCASLPSEAGDSAPAAEPAPRHLHGYPTIDRVLYVQECMRAHPGPHYEMVNKCACALDRLAAELPFEEFVSLSTATNANSIGGERGGVIRDSEHLQVEVRRYRALQVRVKKACFVTP